jgi:hypothetical protein
MKNNEMKLIDFKTVSPLFEQEASGEKPFTVRKIDKADPRFRALGQWKPSLNWGLRITDPATGGNFVRRVMNVSYLITFNQKTGVLEYDYGWRIISLGERVA